MGLATTVTLAEARLDKSKIFWDVTRNKQRQLKKNYNNEISIVRKISVLEIGTKFLFISLGGDTNVMRMLNCDLDSCRSGKIKLICAQKVDVITYFYRVRNVIDIIFAMIFYIQFTASVNWICPKSVSWFGFGRSSVVNLIFSLDYKFYLYLILLFLSS